MEDKKPGKVYLVGCGPGAPDLLTLRAVKTLRKADVVFYDRLVNPSVLKYAARAKKVYNGKRDGESWKQERVNKSLYWEAKSGKTVVRLKNGDPFIFGRGGEELQFLQERGIEVEVIPGLSSAISVPVLAKIPLTQRGISSSLTILTGHRAEGEKNRWKNLGDTAVVLMAVENLEAVIQQIKQTGKKSFTPCALISSGGTEDERLAVSNLKRITDFSKRLDMKAPAVLVVGEVVNSLLSFKGREVVAFRARDEVKRTEKLINRAGGIPKVFEIVEIMPAENELRRAASKKWDTLVFMSASGVRSAAKFFDFGKYRLVAVGGTTRRELRRHVNRRVFVPRVQNTDGVRELLRGKNWGRILAFRSPLAEEKLEGATNIVAYHVKPKNRDQTIKAYIRAKSDFTLLTSSGLLRYLLESASRLGLKGEFVDRVNQSFVISLGKWITDAALRSGIRVNYEPPEPTLDSFFGRSIINSPI